MPVAESFEGAQATARVTFAQSLVAGEGTPSSGTFSSRGIRHGMCTCADPPSRIVSSAARASAEISA